VRLAASRPYNRIGTHLEKIMSSVTCGEVEEPSLLSIEFKTPKNLALVGWRSQIKDLPIRELKSVVQDI